ncbi:MAG: adenosine deaminase [Carnobacterium sp.]|uniref:adenosine deaminase n=1 Tax=Carnobacterium sp. TaxID=48221 RepID=UPI002FC92D7F
MQHAILKKLPKIELHCHLDGSIRPATLRKIAEEQGYPLPSGEQELKQLLQAPEECKNLEEYLTCFDPVLDCLQTEKALETAAYDVVEQAAEENILYIEIRYAPLLSTRNGLSCDAVIEAILKGLAKAEKNFHVKSNLLLCGMRGDPLADNLSVVEAARTFLKKGVAGIDLAGNEKDYPPAEFEDFFQLGEKYAIPITTHAGECGCAQNVRDSILLGAVRIGHGIAVKDSLETIQFCIDKNVLLEICPTSNLQTKTVNSWEDYPFRKFIDAGLKVSINTDNRTVSNTTLTDEYLLLHNHFGLDYALMQKINLDALAYAFTDEQTKSQLAARISSGYLPQLMSEAAST